MNNKWEKLKSRLSKLEKFLFESKSCICCNRECDLDNEYKLCSKCLNNIKFTENNYCLRCGEIIKGDYDYCFRCKDSTYEFDYARSVFAYDEKTSNMIMNFKYNGLKSYATPLAHLLKDFYLTSDLVVDAVTYVPMTKKRLKERGYNQSRELCRKFSELTEIPMIDSLEKIKETSRQATLSAKERRENLRGSFKTVNKDLVKDREILIIDDVFTTGSTTSECAKVLFSAGAKNVQVLTLAKTISASIDNLTDGSE